MKIKLFCAAGMSTSMLVSKMKESAEKNNIDATISAYSEIELESQIDDVDVVLLGPQVSYKLNDFKIICDKKNIPIDVIPMRDYGTMNGDNVLKFALNLKTLNK